MPRNAGPYGGALGSDGRQEWQGDVARAFTVAFSGKARLGDQVYD